MIRDLFKKAAVITLSMLVTFGYVAPSFAFPSAYADDDVTEEVLVTETEVENDTDTDTEAVAQEAANPVRKAKAAPRRALSATNGQTTTVRLQGDGKTTLPDGTYYVEILSSDEWHSQKYSHVTPITVTGGVGEATVKYTNNGNDGKVYLLTYKQGSYSENQYYDQNNHNVWDGKYMYRYSFDQAEAADGTYVVTFHSAGENPTSAKDILDSLGVAYNYGIFTIDYEQHADVESNVAAVNSDSTVDYNFSGNNMAHDNKITVSKSYTENGAAAAGKTVTIVLYKNGKEFERATLTTGSDGTASKEFAHLQHGKYDVYEEINGQLVRQEGNISVGEDKTIEVKYNNTSNLNVTPDFDNSSYIENVIDFGNPRAGSTVVLKKDSDYEKYKDSKSDVTVIKADSDNEHHSIDIAGMLGSSGSLTNYTKTLAKAADGENLTVLNLTYNDLQSLGDKKFPLAENGWTLVNVDMTGCGDNFNGFGQYQNIQGNWDETSLKTIWNFGDYSGTIDGKFCKGVVLAPNATYHTGSVFVGNVIAKKVVIGNEVHFIKHADEREELKASISNNEVEGVVEAAKTDFEAKKVLEGRTLKAGEFSFELYDVEAEKVVETKKNAADGTVKFSEIEYKAEGTHHYIIREVVPEEKLGGVEYDNHDANVTVEVTDNGEGQLVATKTPGEGSTTFTNNYTADGKITLEAKKNLVGRKLNAEEFNFTVKEGEETVATGSNDAKGEVKFTEIKYTLADVGTHTYTVTEDSGELGGVTYDTRSFEVTVKVTDNEDGTLSAEATYPENGVEFKNDYTAKAANAANATLKGTKNLEGRDLKDGEFKFSVKEDGKVVATGKNDADGNITFDELTYSEAGEHHYTVTEDAGELGGITYDTTSFDVTVKVTDDGNGQLVASVEYPENGVKFTNTYAAEGSVKLKADKSLTGRKMKNREFKFSVTENEKEVTTGSNATADGYDSEIDFKEIKYTLDDLGTHEYTVTEVDTEAGGVEYDTKSFKVTVDVTDNGDGTLKAVATYPDNGVKFKNTYTAQQATIELEATKSIEGRALNDKEFSFVVKENGDTVATGKNDADGKVKFSEIKYDAEGTHTYEVTEVAGDLGGVTYDTQSFEVTVTVTDDQNGHLVATATYPENGATFTNKYDAEGEIVLEGTKSLEGRTLDEGEFNFTIKEGDEVVATGTNDAEGKIEFSKIKYELKDVGTHTLVITEETGDKGGVDYSLESYTVTVTVSDNGDGTLDVVAAEPEDGVVFHNTYKTTDTYVVLGAKKNFVGAKLKAGQFSFELKNAEGEVVQTVKNDADGNIAFEELKFSEAGEYVYTISEVKGREKNVKYDETVYTVKINVVDDREGRLIATVDKDGKDFTFTNKYDAPKEKGPKTGDDNNFIGWIGMMISSAMASFVMLFRRRKNGAQN